MVQVLTLYDKKLPRSGLIKYIHQCDGNSDADAPGNADDRGDYNSFSHFVQ